MTHMCISKATIIGSYNGLPPRRRQSIIWTNAGILLTHWGWDKMDGISQTTFPNAFSWMKMYEFRLRFHWILFPRVKLTISQHWFRSWLGAGQATSHVLNQWWLVYWRIYASLGLIVLIRPLHVGTKFSETVIEIHSFSLRKMHLEISSVKWRPFCRGLNVSIHVNKMSPTSSDAMEFTEWNK